VETRDDFTFPLLRKVEREHSEWSEKTEVLRKRGVGVVKGKFDLAEFLTSHLSRYRRPQEAVTTLQTYRPRIWAFGRVSSMRRPTFDLTGRLD
jgi:hypothetical protein